MVSRHAQMFRIMQFISEGFYKHSKHMRSNFLGKQEIYESPPLELIIESFPWTELEFNQRISHHCYWIPAFLIEDPQTHN